MPIKPAILLEASMMLGSSFETNQVSRFLMGKSGGDCESRYDFGMNAVIVKHEKARIINQINNKYFHSNHGGQNTIVAAQDTWN
jgi:hypothetical protein